MVSMTPPRDEKGYFLPRRLPALTVGGWEFRLGVVVVFSLFVFCGWEIAKIEELRYERDELHKQLGDTQSFLDKSISAHINCSVQEQSKEPQPVVVMRGSN